MEPLFRGCIAQDGSDVKTKSKRKARRALLPGGLS
jgi:hypothetical protein